ncbi:hypothetical protein GGQ59_001121 [Parvularcula dongshanensis]|uniref:Uncharacterized protein n=1 Tax=Parvularcula dongshanensis TaxID=1173995 RepID=A0A840I2W5_9PROT|nr:hypothetical protein [Parvularcula dongshanensis]
MWTDPETEDQLQRLFDVEPVQECSRCPPLMAKLIAAGLVMRSHDKSWFAVLRLIKDAF